VGCGSCRLPEWVCVRAWLPFSLILFSWLCTTQSKSLGMMAVTFVAQALSWYRAGLARIVYIYTVHGRLFDEIPAKNNVYTLYIIYMPEPYIYMWQPYTTLHDPDIYLLARTICIYIYTLICCLFHYIYALICCLFHYIYTLICCLSIGLNHIYMHTDIHTEMLPLLP